MGNEAVIQAKMHALFDKALYYADKVIPIAHPFAPFNVGHIALYESDWPTQEKEEANEMCKFIHDVLTRLKYAREQNGDLWLELTNKGRLAKKLGGHLKYLEEMDRLRALKEGQIQSVIDTNSLTQKNIFVTTILAVIVIAIQIRTCSTTDRQISQEEHRLNLDSTQQVKSLKRDSMFYNRPVQVNVSVDTATRKGGLP